MLWLDRHFWKNWQIDDSGNNVMPDLAASVGMRIGVSGQHPDRRPGAASIYVEGNMAGVTGLEPATSGVTGQRSNRLSYTPLGKGRG